MQTVQMHLIVSVKTRGSPPRIGVLTTQTTVAGTSFMAYHFMLDLLSHMDDKDKQQVRNDINISVWEFNKITMIISQLSRNIHSSREHHILFWIKMATHLWILTIRSCIVKISGRLS